MKILLQNQYDGLLGGVETYFEILVQALIKKDHEVLAIYTLSGEKQSIQRNNYKAFYLPNLDLVEDIYYSKKRKREIKNDLILLKSIILKEKPDIIHLNNTYYPSQFIFLRRYVPIIQTVHDFFNCCNTVVKVLPNDICCKSLGIDCFKNRCTSAKSIKELWRFKTKYMNREAMKNFDKLLVTTEYMKEMLVCNGFKKEKIETLPLFIEDCEARPENHKNTIIYAGRLAREKGALHFIQMLKLIPLDFKAFIIGSGPQKEECENLANILGLKEKVEFTGFLNREEIKEYFNKASVVIIPSIWPEPFCLVGIEAMAFSKPVVAYNVGGISSWLQDNYNGFLVNRGDISGLANKVEFLLKDKKLSEEMGQRGRKLYEQKFIKEIHIQKLVSIYDEIILSNLKAKNKIYSLRNVFSNKKILGNENNISLPPKDNGFFPINNYLGWGWYPADEIERSLRIAWSKKEAMLKIPNKHNTFSLDISSEFFIFTGQPSEILIYDSQKSLIKKFQLRSSRMKLELPRGLDNIIISVSRTWKPSVLKPGSKDTRELGICLHNIEKLQIFDEVCAQYPKFIEAETTSRCNMNPPCVMCTRNFRPPEDEKTMSGRLIEKLTPALQKAIYVTLHGTGEPLIDKNIFYFLDTIDQEKTWVQFNTNGLLLNEETIEKLLCKNIKEIGFSIDAATDQTYKKIRNTEFNIVKENIKRLSQIKKNRCLKFPRIVVNMVLMKENMHEVASFIDIAKEVGAEKVFFGLLNPVSTYYCVRRGDFYFDYKSQFVDLDDDVFKINMKAASERSRQLGIEIMTSNKELWHVFAR